LPKSIKVFKSTDSLEGKPFIAYYLEADLKDKNLEFTTETGDGKRYKPSEYFQLHDNPLLVVNGTFFSFETNQNLNVVIHDKKIVAYNVASLRVRGVDSGQFYYPTRSAIGINKDREADVAWIFTDSSKKFVYAFEDSPVIAKGRHLVPSINNLKRFDWKKWKVVTAIGGGPTLIHNGKIHITNKEEQMFVGGEKDKHPRTAMGYTSKNKLIILVVQGRFPGLAEGVTLAQEAKILLDIGCHEALNLDGGGSSCMLVNGIETIKPSDKDGQRPVPGVFMIRNKRK
jgi:exopolysaccharide biosynthesis protein